MPIAPEQFAGVILAGGRSTRMGRDKTWIETEGQPLLLRQIRLLEQVGLRDIAIAAGPENRSALPSTPAGVPLLRDLRPDLGPLAGVAAGLHWAHRRHPNGWTLLIAVDLPVLTTDWLQRLMGRITSEAGCVPMRQGQLEPLATVYPNRMAGLAQDLLDTDQDHRSGNNKASVQEFCRRGLENGWMNAWELSPHDYPTLTNWNFPSDWSSGQPVRAQ